MIFDKLKIGELTIEVSALKPERILNYLWNKQIKTYKVIKLDLMTIRFNISYEDYEELRNAVKKNKGKYKIVNKRGKIVLFLFLKRKASLVIGIAAFFAVIYGLSNFIWAIDIETKSNLSPFEVRRQLEDIGIRPGLKKSDINVYELERKMENINDQIMWIRARIQGSTLRLVIKEKINPPSIEKSKPEGVVAKMDGEIQRVYTYSGNAAVVPGDIVKEGDVLILPIQGREGFEVETKPSGAIIANTFYEKSMEIQVSGKKLERSGNKNSDIYISLGGKKIYLKKVINPFEYYDKIEENNGLIKKTIYFERKAESINIDKEKAVKDAESTLEESLKKILTNDSKIVNRKLNIDDIGEGKILVKVIFTVEQDIAKNIS